MFTPIEPATLTLPWVPPAADRPHATKSLRSSVAVTASTVMPWPVRFAEAPTVARLSTST